MMNRRSFLKGLFGAATVAAVDPLAGFELDKEIWLLNPAKKKIFIPTTVAVRPEWWGINDHLRDAVRYRTLGYYRVEMDLPAGEAGPRLPWVEARRDKQSSLYVISHDDFYALNNRKI